MVRFRGNAFGKVDDKGRIVFPAVFRDEFVRTGEEDMTLVVKKSVQGNCLNLFTRAEWDRRCDQVLEGLDPELNPEHAAFWSKFNDGVYYVVPDGKLGRLNIPSELLEGYKIEIWPKERRASTLMGDETFQATAAKLSAKK